MVMAVTDNQVATLRTFLQGDKAEYNEQLARMDWQTGSLGYSALVTAAFFEAVDRRFTTQSQPAEVVNYVAEVRSRSADIAAELDPRIAERLIREVLGDGSTEDIDGKISASTKLYLVAALMSDAGLDTPGLDQFVAKARKMADHLLSTP
jgi:hypothetical protein